VLFVSHTGQWGGGAEVVLEQLIEAAKVASYDPEVASPSGPLVHRLKHRCSAIHILPLAPLRRTSNPRTALSLALGWLTGVARLGRVIAKSRPVVIHANSGVAALFAGLPATVMRRPLVWHQHDIVPPRLVNRLVLIPGALMCARVVACSNAVARSLVDLGIPSSKVLVMHNRVRDSFFDPLVSRQDARNALSLPDTTPVVAMAGRLVPYKAHGVLLEAVSILNARGVEVLAAIAGDKPSLGPDDVDPFPTYVEGLRRRAAEPDLAGRVIFLGHQDDVRVLFAAADILIQPSIGEPFPLIVLEGLACGVPVIASASGGHVEAIVDGKTGLLTAPSDAADLSAAILRLLSDSGISKSIAAAGRAYARQHFAESGLGPDLRDLYGSITKTPRSSGTTMTGAVR
jgi:glycosyltransferase involved in cell wall biosynthesis